MNKGQYCKNFLKKNSVDFSLLSKKTHKAVFNTYKIQNINLFFLNFLEVIKNKSNKFGKPKLKNKELKEIEYYYLRWILYKEFRTVIKSKIFVISKIKLLKKLIEKYLFNRKDASFFINIKILIFIFISFIAKIKKLKSNSLT